jgi:hypothetical protein
MKSNKKTMLKSLLAGVGLLAAVQAAHATSMPPAMYVTPGEVRGVIHNFTNRTLFCTISVEGYTAAGITAYNTQTIPVYPGNESYVNVTSAVYPFIGGNGAANCN